MLSAIRRESLLWLALVVLVHVRADAPSPEAAVTEAGAAVDDAFSRGLLAGGSSFSCDYASQPSPEPTAPPSISAAPAISAAPTPRPTEEPFNSGLALLPVVLMPAAALLFFGGMAVTFGLGNACRNGTLRKEFAHISPTGGARYELDDERPSSEPHPRSRFFV